MSSLGTRTFFQTYMAKAPQALGLHGEFARGLGGLCHAC